jgi:hypothetical protein
VKDNLADLKRKLDAVERNYRLILMNPVHLWCSCYFFEYVNYDAFETYSFPDLHQTLHGWATRFSRCNMTLIAFWDDHKRCPVLRQDIGSMENYDT